MRPEGSAQQAPQPVPAGQDVQLPGEPEARAERPPAAAAWDAQALRRAGQEAQDAAAEARQPGAAAAVLQRAAAGELRGAQPEARPAVPRQAARRQAARRDVARPPAAGLSAEPWARPRAQARPVQYGTTHRTPAHATQAP